MGREIQTALVGAHGGSREREIPRRGNTTTGCVCVCLCVYMPEYAIKTHDLRNAFPAEATKTASVPQFAFIDRNVADIMGQGLCRSRQ